MSTECTKSTPSCLAVVDIGSNTVKLSVYRCGDDGTLTALEHDADTVRIGYRVSDTGSIADDRLERLIECLKRYEQVSRRHGVEIYLAVATQAFRIASNTSSVIERIESMTAWRVSVLSDERETELTIEGARPWLVDDQWNVVADIGGASTELISVAPDGAIASSVSLAIGSGLLFDEEIGTSPPPDGALDRCVTRALSIFDEAGGLPPQAPNLLLPGGTGHYLRELLSALRPDEAFGPSSVDVLRTWLYSQPATATMERIPVQLDRAQVLPASFAMVEALVLRLTPQTMMAVPSGIRDGIARERCSPG